MEDIETVLLKNITYIKFLLKLKHLFEEYIE